MNYREQEPEGFKTSGGYVTITGQRVDLHDPNERRWVSSIGELIERARRNQLPAWVSEVPEITVRIAAVFDMERAEGKDPYSQVGISGDEVFFHDLKRGTRISLKLRALRADLARGNRLPHIYDTPTIRAALGIAPTPKAAPQSPEQAR